MQHASRFNRSRLRLGIYPMALIILFGCGGSSGGGGSTPFIVPNSCPATGVNGFPSAAPTVASYMNVTVNGSTCSGNTSYNNEPCASVTVCQAGSGGATSCQTINDILIDTGSYGLRIFRQALVAGTYNALIANQESGQTLTECVEYGDYSSQWGPVVTADIVLGSKLASSVPMMIIDTTYAPTAFASKPCHNSPYRPDTTPSAAGFNGILGVGVFQYDGNAAPNYYSCASASASTCSVASPAQALQVQNPVASFTSDNNGIILTFPCAGPAGSANVSGYLIFGIGTNTDNATAGATAFTANASANMKTVYSSYSGSTLSSFIDSGSNALYFPETTATPDCGGTTTGWMCPVTYTNLAATNYDSSNGNANTISFQIQNANNAFSTGNQVFYNLAGSGGSQFDWGLPFFLGKKIFIGISAKSANFTQGSVTGPYFGY